MQTPDDFSFRSLIDDYTHPATSQFCRDVILPFCKRLTSRLESADPLIEACAKEVFQTVIGVAIAHEPHAAVKEKLGEMRDVVLYLAKSKVGLRGFETNPPDDSVSGPFE